jgi:hypothetical protein
MGYLTSPCLGGDVDATEGIEDSLAAAHNGGILDGGQVGRARLEGRVDGADGDDSAVCLDAGCGPRVPGKGDAINLLLEAWVKRLCDRRGLGHACHLSATAAGRAALCWSRMCDAHFSRFVSLSD